MEKMKEREESKYKVIVKFGNRNVDECFYAAFQQIKQTEQQERR